MDRNTGSIGPVVASCEHSTESSSFTKGEDILFDQLSYDLLPKDCCSVGSLNMISSTEWHMNYLEQWFPTYVRPRPSKLFFR